MLRGVLAHHPDTLHHQQRLNAHPMRKPLALQALEFTVQAPGVLFLQARRAHHAPAPAFAPVMAYKLGEQPLDSVFGQHQQHGEPWAPRIARLVRRAED